MIKHGCVFAFFSYAYAKHMYIYILCDKYDDEGFEKHRGDFDYNFLIWQVSCQGTINLSLIFNLYSRNF